jgi:hypothetical protein
LNAEVSSEACLSPQRGLVAAWSQKRGEMVWWTVDRGRLWYRTRRVGSALTATGRDVYWTFGGTLYRLARWPSSLVARRECGMFSQRGACLVPTFVDGGKRSRPVIRFDRATFDPDPFVALRDRLVAPLINRGDAPPRLLLVRGGFVRVVFLPEAGWVVCGGAAAPTDARRIYVNGCRDGQLAGAWVSADRGLSWRAT